MPRRSDPDLARLYHLNSSNVSSRTIDLWLDLDRRPLRFRTYPGAPRYALPGRDFDLPVQVGALLETRASIRDYSLKPLELEKLGRLLHASLGVRGYRKLEEQWSYDRPFPSAGGLYPLEVYVATQQVAGLADGVYHYDARAHQLELMRSGLFHARLADLTIEQNMIRDANLVIIIAAVFERTIWKYGQRGYRYVWIEAGHVGENLYLVAGALGLGPVAIGGFFDEEINRLVGIASAEEDVIYLLSIGQPRESRADFDLDGAGATQPGGTPSQGT